MGATGSLPRPWFFSFIAFSTASPAAIFIIASSAPSASKGFTAVMARATDAARATSAAASRATPKMWPRHPDWRQAHRILLLAPADAQLEPSPQSVQDASSSSTPT